MSVNWDSKFDPPDSFDLDVDWPPADAICDICLKPAEFRVKPSHKNYAPVDLCNNCYCDCKDDDKWGELFKCN